jgi:hypothetical protein
VRPAGAWGKKCAYTKSNALTRLRKSALTFFCAYIFLRLHILGNESDLPLTASLAALYFWNQRALVVTPGAGRTARYGIYLYGYAPRGTTGTPAVVLRMGRVGLAALCGLCGLCGPRGDARGAARAWRTAWRLALAKAMAK